MLGTPGAPQVTVDLANPDSIAEAILPPVSADYLGSNTVFPTATKDSTVHGVAGLRETKQLIIDALASAGVSSRSAGDGSVLLLCLCVCHRRCAPSLSLSLCVCVCVCVCVCGIHLWLGCCLTVGEPVVRARRHWTDRALPGVSIRAAGRHRR